MSSQICFCLLGGGGWGKTFLGTVCTAALSDRDGGCLCVCPRAVCERRAQRRVALSAVSMGSLLLFWAHPVRLRGPGANAGHSAGQRRILPGEWWCQDHWVSPVDQTLVFPHRHLQ